MAQLEGKVQTDPLWLPKSSAVPTDSERERAAPTLHGPLISAAQANPGDFS